MSILGFFTRFTIIYMVVMAVLGVVTGMLGFQSASILNTPVLLGISFWCFYSYSNKNSKIIEGREKWKLAFSALAGDIMTSLLLGLPTMLANDVPIKLIFIGLLIVVPLHLMLYIAVNVGVTKYIIKKRPELMRS